MSLIHGQYNNILKAVTTDINGNLIAVSPGGVTTLAISGVYRELIASASLAAGLNILNGVNIAVGYYCMATLLSVYYSGTTTTVKVRFSLYDGAVYYHIDLWQPVRTQQVRGISVNILLNAGEQFRVTIYNATAGDTFEATILGYLIKK